MVASGFLTATGVAVDGSGNVYVSDYGIGYPFIAGAVYKETPSNGGYIQSKIGSGFESPNGVAVDPSGDVFVVDRQKAEVYRETPSADGYIQSTIGTGWVGLDGVAVDGAGNIYISDNDFGGKHNGIFRETPLNGSYLQTFISTYSTGNGADCLPDGLAVDQNGNIFVPTANCALVELGFAATPSLSFEYTPKGATSFDSPQAVTVVNLGNAPLKFSELSYPVNFPEDPAAKDACSSTSALAGRENCALPIDFRPRSPLGGQKSQTLNGEVTLATNAVNETGTQTIPVTGIEYPPYETLTVSASADPGIGGTPITISAIVAGTFGTPTGKVTFSSDTATLTATISLKDGLASFTTNALPLGATSISARYWGDSTYLGNLASITANIIASEPLAPIGKVRMGSVAIGSTSAAVPVTVTFKASETLGSVAVVTQGAPDLDFLDTHGGTCLAGRKFAVNATCTVNVKFRPLAAGSRYGAVVLYSTSGVELGTGYLQGVGEGPQAVFQTEKSVSLGNNFISISGVAADGNGNLYVADSGGSSPGGGAAGALYKMTPRPNGGYTRTRIGHQITYPWGVAVDGAGNIYVGDINYTSLIKETLQADGTYVESMIGDGLFYPHGVAVDGSGNVYVADNRYFGIFDILLDAVPGVYKETLLPDGTYIQSEIGSYWGTPYGVAVDSAGNLFVAEYGQDIADLPFAAPAVYKESPTSKGYVQTTVDDGLNLPIAIAVDGTGNLFVGDFGMGAVYRESPTSGGYTRTQVAVTPDLPLGLMWGVGLNPTNRDLYFTETDGYYSNLQKAEQGTPPVLSFQRAGQGLPSTDSPQTVTVSNLGNEPLTFSGVSYPVDFPEASGIATDCKSTTLLAQESNCTLTIDFTPTPTLGAAPSKALNEIVSVTTDSLNSASFKQEIAVAGNEVHAVATPVLSLASGTYSTPQKLVITDATPGATIYWRNDGGLPIPSLGIFKYTGPLPIEASQTVKVVATAAGFVESAVASATYVYK